MTYIDLLKKLLPYGCYSDSDLSVHGKDLFVHASALGLCDANGADLAEDEIFPDVVDELISHWERVYGLKQSDIPLFQRRQNLLAAINARNGLKKADVQAAIRPFLGYGVEIEEYAWFYSEDPGSLTEGEKYAWDGQAIYTFTVLVDQARITTPGFDPGAIQDAIDRVKPAHTLGYLDYGGDGFYSEDPASLTELTLTAG